MDCGKILMCRSIVKLQGKQKFTQEPVKELNETSDERIGDSTVLLSSLIPETCDNLDLQA